VVAPPLIYSDPLAAGLLAIALFPTTFVPRRIARMLGLPLFGAGLLLFLSSPCSIRRAGTEVRLAKPASSLADKGPYCFTPFYGGITALANSLPSALLLPLVLVVMQRGVIEREEHYLETSFG
jgi:protein-S-isoprenylcysteine O-methyltransferase Ste14